jgi:hypothetical protein
MLNNKQNKSVNQLLGITSEEAPIYDSYLAKRCTHLCNVPISEFEFEDYRILISQGIALKCIVPPAIYILSQNLFAEGDYYEGDLLKSILTIHESFWKENPILKEELKQICLQDFEVIETINLSIEIKESLYTLVKAFLK